MHAPRLQKPAEVERREFRRIIHADAHGSRLRTRRDRAVDAHDPVAGLLLDTKIWYRRPGW